MNTLHDLPHPLKKTWSNWHALASRLLQVMSFLATFLLDGCSDMVLFHPKGPIGEAERHIIVTASLLMLIVVIPVIVLALWFTWRYRTGSTKDHDYAPKWSYSGKIELAIWVIPAIIVTALGALIWNSTYRLDPYKPIEAAASPVKIEVVSLDWKWLFIYPEENIAVVNELVFPVNVPLFFRVTSDTVMTSFFIPQLGSQIYAMAGMQTRLHLMADEPGSYFGHNQQFSGSGFADMNFKAVAVAPEEFAAWLKKNRETAQQLDIGRYEELSQPTSGYPVTVFSSVAPGLFDSIIGKYVGPQDHPGGMHGPQGFIPPPTARLEGD